ncbi:hypothetical protein A8C75_11045 [Marinobacterium aestuarii]|uniref:Organic solvent tolerance-like N-terminal domain-containing protein n=1 Tax=Marinobacterium aestuarii TaxID=1821621 RepID=A0A1A9EYF4_9GAMM|nr:hypothetical protein [Marinobacterium aestuarii]ANG62966.1 hypothetical protein A8C75_11045 [Marinobacterium aestuarii]
MKFLSSPLGSAVVISSLSLVAFSASTVQAVELNPTFSVDANVEINTDAIDTAVGSTQYTQGGRVEANLRGEVQSERYFVRGKGTLILAKDSDTHTDDMWVQFGDQAWDLQFGRRASICSPRARIRWSCMPVAGLRRFMKPMLCADVPAPMAARLPCI